MPPEERITQLENKILQLEQKIRIIEDEGLNTIGFRGREFIRSLLVTNSTQNSLEIEYAGTLNKVPVIDQIDESPPAMTADTAIHIKDGGTTYRILADKS